MWAVLLFCVCGDLGFVLMLILWVCVVAYLDCLVFLLRIVVRCLAVGLVGVCCCGGFCLMVATGVLFVVLL